MAAIALEGGNIFVLFQKLVGRRVSVVPKDSNQFCLNWLGRQALGVWDHSASGDFAFKRNIG